MYHILLVDDEPIILSGIKFLIDWEKINCKVVDTARNGQQALDKMRLLHPHIVICDISMPVLNGIQLLEQAAIESPDTVFIMLTNHSDFALARDALRFGAVDYLVKSELEAATLEKSLAHACNEWNNRAKLNRVTMVDDYLETNRATLLKDALLRSFSKKPDAAANAILSENGVLQNYGAVCILLDFSGLTGYESLSQQELQRLVDWEEEICSKVARSMFPCCELCTQDGQGLLLLCWGMTPKSWKTTLPLFAQKFAAASTTVTQIEPHLLASSLFFDETEFDDCHRQLFQLQTHFYLTGESGILYDDITPVLAESLYFSGFADRLKAELKAKNNAGCQALIDRAIERIETRPHKKSSAVCLCGELYDVLLALPDDFSSDMGKYLKHMMTRTHVVRWLQQLKNELGEYLGSSAIDKFALIEKAKEYVQNNIEKRIMLQDVADYVCISPGYLSALFKKQDNQNLMDYINQEKVKRACQFIRQGNHLVYEISHKLGYDNAYYFTRVFKRYMGQTPTEYQKGLRGKPQANT